MNYYTLIKDISTIFSFKEIKGLFKPNNYDNILDVYGNYETFIKQQEEPDTPLVILRYFSRGKKLEDKSKEEYSWILIGRINYYHFLLEFFYYYFKYFWTRKDLGLSARTKISYYKTARYLRRTKFYVDIDKYFWKKDYWDNIIKNRFENKEIDNLYLYKGKNDFYNKYPKFFNIMKMNVEKKEKKNRKPNNK